MHFFLRFGLLGLLLLSACAEKTDARREEARRLVAEGKHRLELSQFQAAGGFFRDALAQDPDNREAHFGFGLSELLTTYEQVSVVVRAAGFGDLVPKTAVGDRPGDGETDEARVYNQIILDVLLPLRDQLATAAQSFDSARAGNFAFAVTTVPVKWSADEILNLGGTWRPADAQFLSALCHGGAGLLDLVFAHELTIDLFETLDYFTSYTGSFSSFTISGPKLANVLVYVLEDNPEFLALLARDADGNGTIDGDELPARAREHLRVMAEALATLREAVEGNPGWLQFEGGSGTTIAVLTVDALRVGTTASGAAKYGPLSLPVTEGFETGFLTLAENLAAAVPGAAPRVEWHAHLVPILASVAVSAVGIVRQLDLDLSEAIKSALGLISSPAAVEGLVRDFVPDWFALHPAAWFTHPRGLRDFLPYYRTDLDVRQNSFLLEWECAVGGAVGSVDGFPRYQDAGESSPQPHLTCGDLPIVDQAHFPAAATAEAAPAYAALQVDAIAADGVASGLPYIAFADPSFGGLLEVRADLQVPAGENPIPGTALVSPDRRALNALIVTIVAQLPL